MKKLLLLFSKITAGILLFWTLATIWAQFSGRAETATYGPEQSLTSALLVFNPDPIYNLDEQVCTAIAQSMAQAGIRATVSSIKDQETLEAPYDLYVFCANTYNWAPDWKTRAFIRHQPKLEGKPALSVTVGSGSTGRAQRLLDQTIQERGMQLLGSSTYWLMRPNDEARMEEKNVDVAKDQVSQWALEIAQQFLSNQTTPSQNF